MRYQVKLKELVRVKMSSIKLYPVSQTNYHMFSGSLDFASEIRALRIQNAILRRENAMLEAQSRLFIDTSQGIINIRNIPFNQAKKEVLDLIQNTDRIYFSEIASRLSLDIKEVVKICNELENENLITGVD